MGEKDKNTSDKVFLPTCLNCDTPMEKVEDWGMGMQGGSSSCPQCGGQHTYQIMGGEMTLKCVSVPRGYTGPVEKQFHHREGGI
jgi:Zn finger protein HypA/HybF involved in hydrogenase expression